MDGGGVFGAVGSVYDFDGEAHAFADSTETLDAFGSRFADDFALGKAHDFGIEFSGSGNEVGVLGHGADDAFEVETFAGCELGVEDGHLTQLHEVGGGTAVVTGDDEFGGGNF